jgi:hypothetical protein
MSDDSQHGAFVLGVTADSPAIVGATWWNEALRKEDRSQTRRRFLLTGGILVLGAGVVAAVAETVETVVVTKEDKRHSLEMQEKYGWSFGATTEQLSFDTPAPGSFTTDALRTLPDDLRPRSASLLPFFVPTLFQSSLALPTDTLPDEPPFTRKVSDELTPIESATASTAENRGRSLAALLQPVPRSVAVIVDLPGPEAVAFAAGAAGTFAPVFTFDNWPHPRGVVPAHKTLATAAGYQAALVTAAASRAATAAPLFVLDRYRLAPHDGSDAHFDNRYLARLPSPDALHQLGYPFVLYICPQSSDVHELDDLNDLFVAYAARGLSVHALGADAITRGADGWRYGGSAATENAFFADYPFWPGAPKAHVPSGVDGQGPRYLPTRRQTAFSAPSAGSAGSGHAPADFALVPVVLAGTGVLLGARMNRFGSWNRTSGGYGGG